MHKLNLLPKEILRARKSKVSKFIILFILFTILVANIIFYLWLDSELIKTTDEIEKTMNLSMPVLQSSGNIDLYLEKQQAILDIYEHIDKNKYVWPKLIKRIASTVPKKTILTSVSINEDGQLKLKGVSPKTTYIGILLSYLEQIKDITKLNLDFINYDNSLYIYEVSALIKIR